MKCGSSTDSNPISEADSALERQIIRPRCNLRRQAGRRGEGSVQLPALREAFLVQMVGKNAENGPSASHLYKPTLSTPHFVYRSCQPCRRGWISERSDGGSLRGTPLNQKKPGSSFSQEVAINVHATMAARIKAILLFIVHLII